MFSCYSDLPFKKGDIVSLRRQIDDNWYQGELNGQIGVFPSSYVQVQLMRKSGWKWLCIQPFIDKIYFGLVAT